MNQVTPPPVKPDSDVIKTTVPIAIGTPTIVPTPNTQSTPSNSDNKPTTAPKDAAIYADVMPSFPGGQPALEKYLKNHIQFTPVANDAGAEGKVFISFVIDVDGSVGDVKLVKDKMGYGCAQNAMDVIENMPLWIPGSTNGHTLAVRVILPIDFKR